ncbi:MAG: SDR family oxidoreductase [Rhodospirillales bacterium]|nr:SDR family oxidoreductase [Rhodospirillales bacterium]MDP6646760.1 SDR family oxidoreductase [Rhodospirillales bacterium]MDP6843243.1 SDR family oxidoreductase [Rhodospirillales bacterium]
MPGISLAGKVIIVTGGGRGLGRAMVLGLAEAGAVAVAAELIAEDMQAAEPEAARSGKGRVHRIDADIRKPEDCRRAVEETVEKFGAVHGLINNAGLTPTFINPDLVDPDQAPPKFWETADGIVQAVIDSNYVGASQMARLVAPRLAAQGWGRIVNVTTMFETMVRPGTSSYGASKAALEMASVVWNSDLAGTGVTVNILNPGGAADTAGVAHVRREAARRGTLPPLMPPQQMVAPAVWLCSEESDGVTGMRFDASPWNAAKPPGEEAKRIGRPLGFQPHAASA